MNDRSGTRACRLQLRPHIAALLLLLLAACTAEPDYALGTLEYDRITLPAPAAERIVDIAVREGERVEAGARILSLEHVRGDAELAAARAEVANRREALDELRNGARAETLDQARANVAAAQAQARDARAYFQRLRPLGSQQLASAADVDRARAASGNAEAQVAAARAALAELRNGVRPEQVAQGEAALVAAEARLQAQAFATGRLDVVAPRAGRVDSLPYRLGDQAPVGAPLAVMLVGEAPFARVHVPEPLRAGIEVGDRATVLVGANGERRHAGRVRMIRNEPAFTPYYALAGEDAARLSYLAEVELEDAGDLPAGLPLRVVFDGGR
ncbi:HlyD family efflux transporter periplasmic adaptor subunit [Luteimonas sp. MC1572]|uniref:HlyD family secretion protein n=1 Tax=Luteimonas sp. MC1572 TaxID=2799325 RepID=UPI0018F09FB7|nr:HlyD family efflux transporter periplasmic adaptor subunit [Luteimonas sp. MC1572]MBJ6982600.1 HlyD family efflux transporter periplasmic adaptor subunit [Luteimonas sp. MC1572]QQO03848.1 HlyD family efflux transporter periplasmic adaptor subunit [Luteimonas sp. MC1572]